MCSKGLIDRRYLLFYEHKLMLEVVCHGFRFEYNIIYNIQMHTYITLIH